MSKAIAIFEIEYCRFIGDGKKEQMDVEICC